MPRKKKEEMKVTSETGVKVLTENFVDAEPTDLDQAIAKAAADNTNTDADIDGDTDGDNDSDTNNDNDVDSNNDGDSDTDTDSDEDTDSNIDSDTDSDADSDSDADTDVDTDPDTDPPPMQEQEWTYETCKVDFTEQELAEMSGDMARKIGDLRDKEDQQKSVAAQMKAEIKTLSGEVEQLAVKVRNKFEYKQVKCEVIRDYQHKEISYFRLDTGELHKRRTMRADEAQTELSV